MNSPYANMILKRFFLLDSSDERMWRLLVLAFNCDQSTSHVFGVREAVLSLVSSIKPSH